MLVADAPIGSNLSIRGITHVYGAHRALDNVSVECAAGEFLTLLGSSGSGKTTLLRAIGGLIRPTAGRIVVGDRDVTELPPERRDIGFVFQNYALFPHMTVAENVGFALTVRKTPPGEINARVKEALSLVGLDGIGKRYPGQMSGGQQQRVALARALVFRPAMLLLDEPLGALDRQLRQQLAVELRGLQRKSGITMVYVTHDQEEAFTMSTRIAVMTHGRIRQLSIPTEIYRQPQDLTVARFVGDLNEAAGRALPPEAGIQQIETPDGPLRSITPQASGAAGDVTVTVRPEHLGFKLDIANAGPNDLPATVIAVIYGGSWFRIDLRLGSGTVWRLENRGEPPAVSEGQAVLISVPEDKIMIFRSDPSLSGDSQDTHSNAEGAA